MAATGRGTYRWTAAQKAELLQTGRVSGFQGHHINSVKGHPGMAGNPNNVEFVKGSAGNLAKHGGDFRNATQGSLLNRSLGATGKVATGLAVAVSVYYVTTAPAGEKVRTAVQETGALGGAMAGGTLGVEVGAFGGPWGAAAGGIVGSVGGGLMGSKILDTGKLTDQQLGEWLDKKLPKP